jgi:hypothetical protein
MGPNGDEFDGLPREYANWVAQRSFVSYNRTAYSWEPGFPDIDDHFPVKMLLLVAW